MNRAQTPRHESDHRRDKDFRLSGAPFCDRRVSSRAPSPLRSRTARMTLRTGIDLRPVVGVLEIDLQSLAIAAVPEQRFVFG